MLDRQTPDVEIIADGRNHVDLSNPSRISFLVLTLAPSPHPQVTQQEKGKLTTKLP